MKTFIADNIVWDQGDQVVGLPVRTLIQAEDEEGVADALSDRFDFAVDSLLVEELSPETLAGATAEEAVSALTAMERGGELNGIVYPAEPMLGEVALEDGDIEALFWTWLGGKLEQGGWHPLYCDPEQTANAAGEGVAEALREDILGHYPSAAEHAKEAFVNLLSEGGLSEDTRSALTVNMDWDAVAAMPIIAETYAYVPVGGGVAVLYR